MTASRLSDGRRRRLREDPSGYTTAFTHPDPIDPNDRKRQQTQSRAGNYPYDMPVMYGREVGTDSGGAAYQAASQQAPPVPKKGRIAALRPEDPWNLALEMAEDMTAPYEPGEQADDAFKLGYGSHGRMGEDGEGEDVDMDDLRKAFRSSIPAEEVVAVVMDLLSLLSHPEEGADSDDGCGGSIYSDGDEIHVFAPDAEDDPETL